MATYHRQLFADWKIKIYRFNPECPRKCQMTFNLILFLRQIFSNYIHLDSNKTYKTFIEPSFMFLFIHGNDGRRHIHHNHISITSLNTEYNLVVAMLLSIRDMSSCIGLSFATLL